MWHSQHSITQRQTFNSPAYQKIAFSRKNQQAPTKSNLLRSQREVQHHNRLTFKKNQVVGDPINYKRVYLEQKRHLLGSIQTYILTRNQANLSNVIDKHQLLQGLQSLGSVASALKKMKYYSLKKHSSVNSTILESLSRESRFDNQQLQAKILHVDQNFNLTIKNNQIYGIPTDYGIINYHFIDDGVSRYVKLLHYDNQISDHKRVHLERKRQLLQDIQTFIHTGSSSWLHTARDNSEILQGFESFGITTEEPFTINNGSKRYRISPYGILHDVDLESKATREQDWRKFGHDENTIFLIQGKEYKMDENGRLPLPEDYVHKFEQVKIFKRNEERAN